MIQFFYSEYNISKYLELEMIERIKILKIKKGKEIYLLKRYFHLEGQLDIFITSENHEKTIKLKKIDKSQKIIGVYSDLNPEDMTIFYKAKTDVVLLEIPDKCLEDIYFIKKCNEILFKSLIDLSKFLVFKNSSSKEQFVKYILKKKKDENNFVSIKNLVDFREDHGVSRSTFYSSLKKLENSKELKKVDKGYFICD